MIKLQSRVLGVRGVYPVPGQDTASAPWLDAMTAGEIVVFYFDAMTGALLSATGKKPASEMLEICLAFRSEFVAKLAIRGAIRMNPNLRCAMYDKRGRWLMTASSRDGVQQRNPMLARAMAVARILALGAVAMLAVLALSVVLAPMLKTTPIRWNDLQAGQKVGLYVFGLLNAVVVTTLWYMVRFAYVSYATRAARQPIGSEGREVFYKRLEKTKKDPLTPLDVELELADIDWVDREKHDRWMEDFAKEGFECAGAYRVLKTGSSIEFFFNTELRMMGYISQQMRVGIWIEVTSRYSDGSMYSVVAREASGLDSHPKRKKTNVSADATVAQIVAQLLRERPEGERELPVRELVLDRFKASWREYMEWRRAKGTSAEEYKRIDLARMRRKGLEAAQGGDVNSNRNQD